MGDRERQGLQVDTEKTVLNVELLENLDHLLDEKRSPSELLIHVLMVHPVGEPDGNLQLVEVSQVQYYDRRLRAPVLTLALDVAANNITSEIDMHVDSWNKPSDRSETDWSWANLVILCFMAAMISAGVAIWT